MGARRGKPIPYLPVYDLDNIYSYHKPSQSDITRHAAIRDAASAFAGVVLSNAGSGRERSLALTQIEQAMFWANAAVAREPDE